MNKVLEFLKENQDIFIKEISEFISIPSVSANPERKGDVRGCAEFLISNLKSIGMENVKLFETPGNPICYADWLHAPNAPTVLIYGHYDVQPEDPIELWNHPPFKGTVIGDELFGRGATDDKGQLWIHVKAVEAYLKNGNKLPVNIKFILEGEEEIGSHNLEPFVEEHRDLLKADVLLVSDTAWFARGVPSIVYGVRGLAYIQVDVTGPKQDLHSGRFGGAVVNPINALAEIISRLKDENGRITIPRFYDDVADLSHAEKKQITMLPFNENGFKEYVGTDYLSGEKGFSTLERLSVRPTLDVCGIWGGFQEQGTKTVLPSKAGAKISMRLVPNQNPHKIGEMAKEYIMKIAPRGVKIEIQIFPPMLPGVVPIDSPAMKAAAEALKEASGKTPLFQREGGSIPVAADFKRILGLDTVFMGFGLPDENAHSPNEKLNLNNFFIGLKASAIFFEKFGKLQNG